MPCSGKLLIEAIRQHCLLDQALVNRLLKQLEQKQKKKQTSQSAAAGNSAADWRDPPILRFRKWGFQGVGSSAQTSIFITAGVFKNGTPWCVDHMASITLSCANFFVPHPVF